MQSAKEAYQKFCPRQVFSPNFVDRILPTSFQLMFVKFLEYWKKKIYILSDHIVVCRWQLPSKIFAENICFFQTSWTESVAKASGSCFSNSSIVNKLFLKILPGYFYRMSTASTIQNFAENICFSKFCGQNPSNKLSARFLNFSDIDQLFKNYIFPRQLFFKILRTKSFHQAPDTAKWMTNLTWLQLSHAFIDHWGWDWMGQELGSQGWDSDNFFFHLVSNS